MRYGARRQLLVITRGHPFARQEFAALFDSWPDVSTSFVEHPAAEVFYDPSVLARFDAVVFYDMPGIDFAHRSPLRFVEPSPAVRDGMRDVLDRGTPIVFLHHAIAAWPTWPQYGEWTGARFLYAPGSVGGVAYPDSGYRHEVTHRVVPVDSSHPLFAGLSDGYEITDELYLCPVHLDRVEILATSTATFTSEHFYSAAQAIAGKRNSSDGWTHPDGSNAAVWAQRIGPSQTVTVLGGDGPDAYANPGFRTLLRNAVEWTIEGTERQ
jgi:uncharacterized protein